MATANIVGPVPVQQMLTPYAHHSQTRDAVTKGPVTRETKLATMYTGEQHANHDRLLASLTGLATPGIRCNFKMGLRGTPYPETDVKGAQGYDLYITYNRLVSILITQSNHECLMLIISLDDRSMCPPGV